MDDRTSDSESQIAIFFSFSFEIRAIQRDDGELHDRSENRVKECPSTTREMCRENGPVSATRGDKKE